ncbi:MAG TPA: GxxExxY protein [Rhodopila sp.]|jgi:GxxExxY protein|nr:GxxExxY protein [Rhodopila sp.]
MLQHQALTEHVIGLAIDVHRTLGPGLLESVYSECLSEELTQAGIPFAREVNVPVTYKGKNLPLGFRADIVVANVILLEIKGVAALLPTHEAQIRTYLRLSRIQIGLLMNFHALRLKDGLRRFIV